ncbi:MAG: hypothetical protein KC594_03595 [Nitrospira sp.]|nr:hypothetical protein [Nitrospira sp.]
MLYWFVKRFGFAVQFHCGVQWVGLKFESMLG